MMKTGRTFFFLLTILIAANVARGQDTAAKTASAPLEFSADALEYRQNKSAVILTGNVRVSQGEVIIMSDLIELHQMTDKSGVSDASELAKIKAFGNVVVERPSEKATSDNGSYDLQSETITLSGNVTLRQRDNILRGDRLDINLRTGISRIHGTNTNGENRVKGVLNPQKLYE